MTRRDPIQVVRAADVESVLVLSNSADAPRTVPHLAGRVALACTSPPYSNAISYTTHSEDPSANYRDRPAIDYANYLDGLDLVWRATWEMLKLGGVFAINAGTVLDNGAHTPLPQDIAARLISDGDRWEYVRTILWNKVTAGVKRAGSVIQHPYPGYWHPNIMTEHVVIVRKRGGRATTGVGYPSEWDEDIWDIAPVPPRQVPHPAPFPEEIPHRCIRMFTDPGDYVMDPFNGAGATTKAAWDLGRNGLGFDLEPKYVAYAERRLHETTSVRPQQLSIEPVAARDFVPRSARNKGKTRHGAGLATRRKKGPA